MSIKAYKINSNLAQYTDEEFSSIEKWIAQEGVFDKNGTDTDFEVTESTPNAMTVDIDTGAVLVEYTKNAVTWKVISDSSAAETLSVSANTSGVNRVDAVVVRLKQVEANALKNNIAELLVVLGSGATALTDGALDTYFGDSNWYRLADITVPDSAVTITSSDIADTRDRVTLDALPTDGDTRYVKLIGDESISGIKTFLEFPILVSGGTPTENYQAATKKYVDDMPKQNNLAVLEAGEAIDGSSTPKTLCTCGTDYKDYELLGYTSLYFNPGPTSDVNMGDVDARTRQAVQFTPTGYDGADTITIEQVLLFLSWTGVSTDGVAVEIWTDNAGEPGAVVSNGTSITIPFADLGGTGTYIPQPFLFSTPPEVTNGTPYWVVFKRTGLQDPAKYYEWYYKNAGVSASWTQTTNTWNTGTLGLVTMINYHIDYGNKAFLADANNFQRGDCIGITNDNVSAGADVTSITQGTVDGFTGLTDGVPQYLGNTPGAIDTDSNLSETNISAYLGQSYESTKINLNFKLGKAAYGEEQVGMFYTGDSGSDLKEILIPIQCGFRPRYVELTANLITGVVLYTYTIRYVDGVSTISYGALDGVYTYNTIEKAYIGDLADNAIKIDSFTGNGFVLRHYSLKLGLNFTWIARG